MPVSAGPQRDRRTAGPPIQLSKVEHYDTHGDARHSPRTHCSRGKLARTYYVEAVSITEDRGETDDR